MKTMEMLNSALILLVIILVILLVVQWVVIVNQKKEKDNLAEWLNDCADKLAEANTKLAEYKIREEAPIPMVKNIDYLILEKEVKSYKPPYKVGQKVMYSDEGFAKVGYIHGIRTEQYEIIHEGTDKKEVVVKHLYEIGSKHYRDFCSDIIDVVKENKK